MPPVLLAIAHGSRDPRHAATVRTLIRRVRSLRPGQRVDLAFLDFDVPSVRAALESLAADGERDVVALPLILTRAFHTKVDIPTLLRDAPARLRIRQAAALGPSPLLLQALERRLYEAGLAPADKSSTGVVLASAGTSDPEASAVIAAIAREWRRTGWCAVRPAFASLSPRHSMDGFPGAGEAVHRLRALGCARVAVAPYVLAPGFLPDRITRDAGQADVVAPVLGDAPELAELVWCRFDQTRSRVRRTELAVP